MNVLNNYVYENFNRIFIHVHQVHRFDLQPVEDAKSPLVSNLKLVMSLEGFEQ